MAFQGNPLLLNEIKKGFKLRPTQTVDKSAPIIQADEEDLPTVRFVKPDKPADLSYLYAKKDPDDIVVWRPRSIVPPPIIHKGTAIQNGAITQSRPTTPNPPTGKPITNPVLLKLGGQQQDCDRKALLNSIKGGIKLKKTVTSDRSGLIVNDEMLSDLNSSRANTPSSMSTRSISQETLDSQPSSQTSTTSSNEKADPASPPKVRRKTSTAKTKKKASVASGVFVPAKPIENAPPPPPPPPMAPPPMPMKTSVQGSTLPPPPPPPPPMAPSPSMSMKRQPFNPSPVINQVSIQEFPTEPPKKCDVAFDEKNLYVTREDLDAEIKKGSASSRIALFKQFEQNGSKAPMPKTLSAMPGKLKIIENASKDAPPINGRLKIHEEATISSVTRPKKLEKQDSTTSINSTTSKKYAVPISVTTDEPSAPTSPKKTSPKKLSNGKAKRVPKTTTDTLSPTSTRLESLSPNSASSAYQSGISSPNSVSSISPKSKSSGISSTTSSVSPPIRISSLSNGTTTTTKEKSPPPSNKIQSVSSERFSQLRQSFSEKNTESAKPPPPVPPTKSEDSGEQFWKSAVMKSNGLASSTTRPVEIKTPWLSKSYSNSITPSRKVPSYTRTTAYDSSPRKVPSYTRTTAYESSSYTPLRTTITTAKKPPTVPPKRAPITIKISNFPVDTNSYLDEHNYDETFRRRYKFDIDLERAECPVEIVQR